MNKSVQFTGFLDSLKDGKNDSLIESVKAGFALLEGEEVNPTGEWFDTHGWVLKEIPEEAVKDIAVGGRDAQSYVTEWVNRLGFKVPADLARRYLVEFGAWSREELDAMDDNELAEKTLWIAANDIAEQGEWQGLVH